MRWRKQPREKGLAAVCQGTRGFDLHEDGEYLAYVRPKFNGFHRDIVGWYWYGMGQNTAHAPVSTPEEAKQQAMEYCHAALAACAREGEKPQRELIAEWREKAKNLRANVELCDRDEESKYQELAIQRETMAEELERALERAAGEK